MARSIPFLLLLAACGTCLEMKETVERMVMVRTTGSDLQPEATGYLYKKESDGPAEVTQMGESEVMEHLTKFYEQPQAFAAPIPVAKGPFHVKEEDENKAASQSSERLIPVVEKSEEQDDSVDGIADDDYTKHYADYAKHYADSKKSFDEYLKGLGHFEDGVYHEHSGGKEHDSSEHHAKGDKDYKGYKAVHHYGKGDGKDYNTKKYETYSVSSAGGHKKNYNEGDAYGDHYAQGKGYKHGDHGHKSAHSNDEGTDGFHKLYDKQEDKKDHDFYDGSKYQGGYHKYDDGHGYYGAAAGGHKEGESHDSGHHGSDYGKHGHHEKASGEEEGSAHSKEAGEESSYGKHSDFGSEGLHHGGKAYGFKVQH